MTGDSAYTVRLADWAVDEAALGAIRHDVFVVEQQVPPALEWDGVDPACRHAIAEDREGWAIGCGRLLPDGHIGRMAVLPEWRGKGVGTALLSRLIESARQLGMSELALNAQTSAIGFYRRFGFVPDGDEFIEAGIAHVAMVRSGLA